MNRRFAEGEHSLTSPSAKGISGSKNFRSSPQKDFCNNIDGIADMAELAAGPTQSRMTQLGHGRATLP